MNHRFQESDAPRLDWRLVLVYQATSKLPKITLEGSRRVYYEAIDLIVSAIYHGKLQLLATPRWRPSWLELLMMTTMRQSSSFLKHHTAEMLIQGRYLGMQLSILKFLLKEKISCFDGILMAVSKFPEPEKKLTQEAQTICKLPVVNPPTSAAGERSFSSARRLKT